MKRGHMFINQHIQASSTVTRARSQPQDGTLAADKGAFQFLKLLNWRFCLLIHKFQCSFEWKMSHSSRGNHSCHVDAFYVTPPRVRIWGHATASHVARPHPLATGPRHLLETTCRFHVSPRLFSVMLRMVASLERMMRIFSNASSRVCTPLK